MNNINSCLSALAHPHRMALVRLLVRRYPDHVPAGEIAAALGLKSSTASVYLAALTRAGLLTQERVGTSLRYTVELDALRGVMTDLLSGWRSRPDLLPDLPFAGSGGPTSMPEDRSLPMPQAPATPTLDATNRYDVLFICTGNSARSIFAEAILRDIAGDRFHAHSAGTKPYSELNPIALEVLESKGHDVSPMRSKNIGEFQGPDATIMDFVFTVCDLAANEECPPWPGQPISAHWGQPDPVKATGTRAERMLAFQQVYGALHNRIHLFTQLPIASLDALSLQRQVDEIGRQARAKDPA
ncbi:MAG: helix-turn-helix domain-containing protein [Pseudomonadota bacterium]